jgi:DNA-binding NtrC family response regulator
MDVNESSVAPGFQTHVTASAPVLLGDSAAVRDLRDQIARVAGLNLTVLIEGAVGTGKSAVTRAIHHASRRQGGPFVARACGDLDPETAASAFFGHRRGAFNGADDDRAGLFEAADGGTLLLDRVGDLPPRAQATLLRVVEERIVRRLGDTAPKTVDVRLLATTHRDLAIEVQAGRFREDLFYRLRVLRLLIPPLESRREDIPLLANAFRHQACLAHNRHVDRISDDAMQYLLTRSWPENIAELRITIETAVRRSTGAVLELTDLQEWRQRVGR